MKVLTLHQPWATLVALGLKAIETRPWPTAHRGQLAIHAATRPPADARVGDWLRYVDGHGQWWITNAYAPGAKQHHPTPTGVIVAVCELVDVVPAEAVCFTGTAGSKWVRLASAGRQSVMSESGNEPLGDFSPGRFAWLLDGVFALDEPVPFKGGRRLTKTWEPGT